MGDNSDTPSCKELTSEELCKQMDKLLKENSNNQRIYDWIEVRVRAECLQGILSWLNSHLTAPSSFLQANLSEQQVSSNTFIRALMTSVCHSAITCEYWGEVGAGVPLQPPSHTFSPAVENPYRVDALVISNRAKLLQKYMRDEQKELQALYALQALVVKLDQPPSECHAQGWMMWRGGGGVAGVSLPSGGGCWLGYSRVFPSVPLRPAADVL